MSRVLNPKSQFGWLFELAAFLFGEGAAQALPLVTSELCLPNTTSPSSHINPTGNQNSCSPEWDSSFWGPFSRYIWAQMHTSKIRPFTKCNYSHFFWRSSWSMGCNHNPASLSRGQGMCPEGGSWDWRSNPNPEVLLKSSHPDISLKTKATSQGHLCLPSPC